MKKSLFTAIFLILILTLLVSCNVENPPDSVGGESSSEETPGSESTPSITPCEHTYDEWITEKEPTCTNSGTEYAECTKCGEKKTVIKRTLGHIRSDNKCTRCGCTLESIGLEFESNGDGTCSVVGLGTCNDLDVIIPSKSPEGDMVTSIGNWAFEGYRKIKSVFIPECVKSIGAYAFYGQMITYINISNGVERIGEAAFASCIDLIGVNLPESLTVIENCAFDSCTNLKSVSFGNANGWYADDTLMTPDEDENIKVEFTDDEEQNAEYLTSIYGGFYRFTRK